MKPREMHCFPKRTQLASGTNGFEPAPALLWGLCHHVCGAPRPSLQEQCSFQPVSAVAFSASAVHGMFFGLSSVWANPVEY